MTPYDKSTGRSRKQSHQGGPYLHVTTQKSRIPGAVQTFNALKQ